LAARRVGLPVILSPQTIGPFTGPVNRAVARYALGSASSVFARDSASYDYARSIGGRRVERATDVVFALPVPNYAKHRDVIVNVSGLLWQENRHVDHRAYRDAAQRLVAGLISRGRRVSLLAHVIDNPTKDNDLVAMRALQASFGDELELLVPNSLDEVRQMLASAEIVVGSRMHACLNAISVGTPAIPWAYSRKFAPLLSDLHWPISVDLRAGEAPDARTLELIDDDKTAWDELLQRTRAEADARVRLFSRVLSDLTPRPVGV
jgi:polysaccharide pyruvyl transferase WcaK-like protein